ncbi:MAG: trimethylamine methyltransferase family protein [Arenicellales bacterium]|nr:trimethylamine methyltransferase family protein [Arenicellales bacterium]
MGAIKKSAEKGGTRQTRKRARAQRKAERSATTRVAQLDFGPLRNRYPPMEPLSEDQVEAIHQASLKVIRDLGIEIMSEPVRQAFARQGAKVDHDTGIVCADPQMILDLVSQAPAEFTLTPRNPAHAITLGGNRVYFGLVSGPPNVHDRVNGRRPGNFADYQRLISLGQYFNAISVFGNQTVATQDLPAGTRHLDSYRANLTLADKVFSAIPIGRGRVNDAVQMLALARGISVDDLHRSPSLIGNININSPRKLDEAMSDGALALAAHGQAVIVTPFTLLGAMTPVTLAAGLVQQNAEALMGLAMIQLFYPGNPVVYGGFTSNVDMRSGAPAFGTPENAKANLAGGQLARRYGLPYRTSACNASNAADAQGVYETQMALWGAVMGHGNLVYHAAGWLEGGLVASFEKLVLDIELIQHLVHLLQPIDTSESELGLDAIAAVAPGGHFFGTEHTMARYENAFYEPFLSDWQNSESWAAAGAADATERATDTWQDILKDFEAPPLDVARREALDDFVTRRKKEIGTGEP